MNPLRKLLMELQEATDTRIELNDSDRTIGRKVGQRELLETLESLIEEKENGTF
jgi:hypothetical protein